MLLRLSALTLLSLCTAAHADVTHLDCLQTGPTEYKITYALTGNTHSVQLFAGTNAQSIPTTHPLLTSHDGAITVKAGGPGQRMYFLLTANTGEQREVSIRHLALEGAPNFRDLGGYQTTDGHFVRWGMLYRSAVLTNLTPSDMKYLSQTGIRVVCDFRSQHENDISPEVWLPDATVKKINLPIGGTPAPAAAGTTAPAANAGPSLLDLAASNPTVEQLTQKHAEMYSQMIVSAAPQFAALFAELKQADHLPLLYHCTGGRDRTGVFSALVLLTLGVPEKTVVADYALTGKYLTEGNSLQQMSKASDTMTKLTPEQLKTLVATRPEYLEGGLRVIDQKYGSFDNYRRQELHVSDQEAQDLRNRLLTK